MDPFSLLGLAPGADAKAIKRAFRRLAMQWHPDRNPAPEALEHFKRLRAAYEALLTPPPDLEEEPAPPPPARGADRTQTLVLGIEAFFHGGAFPLEVLRLSPCGDCDGSGTVELGHSRLCGDCHGSGRLRQGGGLVACPACHGRGYRREAPCPACEGRGEREQRQKLMVQVPAGMLPGDELRLQGQGEAGPEGGLPGDLRITLQLAPHPLYVLQGRNLILARPLSPFRLMLGGTITVPGPTGLHTVDIPPGLAENREVALAGAGIPGRRGEPAGDLLIRLQAAWPQDCQGPLQAPLEALESALQRDLPRYLPDLADWEARWL